MRRVLQPSLMRGRIANRAATLLLLALLTVLTLSVVQGVGNLHF